MRNLILLEYSQDLMYVINNGKMRKESKYNKRFDKVPTENKSNAAIVRTYRNNATNYNELYNEVVNNIITNKNNWLNEYEIPQDKINEIDINEIKLKGDFNSDFFMIQIQNGYNIVCMTEEKYETVRYLWADKLIDYINYETGKLN